MQDFVHQPYVGSEQVVTGFTIVCFVFEFGAPGLGGLSVLGSGGFGFRV